MVTKRFGLIGALLVLGTLVVPSAAFADDQTHSSNYSVGEVQIGGSGSASHSCSASYCGKITVGDTTVGTAKSDNYSARFGSDTSDIPLLEVIATAGVSDMGTIDTDKTGTATKLIKVRSYLSSGYTMQIVGTPPKSLSHTLAVPMGEGGTGFTSQPGTEQFGLNLAANDTPNIGAGPIQVPSSQFSFGGVYSGYDEADSFKYVSGETVAGSTRSTGETDYTLSMILNVSPTTPGGHYTAQFSVIIVPNY